MGAGLNAPGSGYHLIEFAESPRRFHGRALPTDPVPQVWLNTVTEPALVLGSTQRDESVVDAAACFHAGIDVVRRHSGGGAVLLVPGEVTWIDVIVPRGAPGWADDIHVPMVWLGRALAALFGDVAGSPVASVKVHAGPMSTTPYSARVCFDGVGPGELLVDGAKLVGISQRRTRHAARLQCCWYHRYEPGRLMSLLADRVRPPTAGLRPVATVGATTSDAVVRALPAMLSR